MSNKLEIGIFGLGRGMSYASLFSQRDDAEVVAGCDQNPAKRENFARQFPEANVHAQYADLLNQDFDILVLCSYCPDHALHAIQALEAGKHVLSEITACHTLEQGKDLVRAVKSSRKKYMLAENYAFSPFVETWEEMATEGRLGQIMYAEGEYVHDIRSAFFNPDGSPHWRSWLPPIYYCTHSLGPLLRIMQWDRCLVATGFHTGSKMNPELGNIDMEVGLFQTASGAVIKVLCGFSQVREPPSLWYCLYGTKGTVETDRSQSKWFGYLEDAAQHGAVEHPLTRDHPGLPPAARLGGHGTSEWVLVDAFLESVVEDKTPPIDVYRALDMTLPGICAHQSALSGGKPVEIPDFR